MLKIVITGNIACGKNFVGDIFHSFDIPIIDADKIVHELYSSKNHVSEQIIKLTGVTKINRDELRKRFFHDKKLKEKIEKIVHPEVLKQITDFFEKYKNQNKKIAIALVPLLFEAKVEKYFDKYILVYCKQETQIKRLQARNPSLSIEEIQQIINAQISQDLKKEKVHFIIDNSRNRENTIEQVKSICQELQILN